MFVALTCTLTTLAFPTIAEKRQCDTSGCKADCEAAGYVSCSSSLCVAAKPDRLINALDRYGEVMTTAGVTHVFATAAYPKTSKNQTRA